MPRQNKKSRMKFLPPKIQLDERMAATGSYPTVSRPSVDGRTGNYSVSFDDTKTLLFLSYSNIEYGVGLPSSSLYFSANTSLRQNETATQFSGSGNLVKGIGDATPMVHFTLGQDGGPFRDNDQYAVDGKSSNSDFYSTGTSIQVTGEEGFDVPLWSKDKIEIDISCNSTVNLPFVVSGCNVGATNNEGDRPPSNTEGQSYPMAYYNFAEKKWEGIGTGATHGTFAGTSTNRSPYTDFYYQGFAPGIINFPGFDTQININNWRSVITGAFEFQASAGQPTSNFGFPHHSKYHATSSQTFKMSDVIDRPFVLEKIVVQMSAAYDVSSTVYSTSTFRGYNIGETITDITEACIPASISSFFIACQRKNVKVNYRERMERGLSSAESSDKYYTTNIPYNIVLSQNGSTTYINTIRDLLTWGNVTSFTEQVPSTATRVGNTAIGNFGSTVTTNSPRNLLSRDVNINKGTGNTTNISSVSWSTSLKMELPIKSLARIDRNDIKDTYPNDANMFGLMIIGSGSFYLNFNLKNSNGGFNNLGILYPTGRNIRSPIRNINVKSNYDSGNISYNKEVVLVEPSDRYTTSPYILQPSDELIIGWQQPIPIGCHASLASAAANNPRDMSPGTLSTTTFPQGPAKLVLYGSYLSEGKPKNDSLNQLLSSDSVHEIIGEG